MTLESKVDGHLLTRMLDWTDDIQDFERHHAVDGLFHAKGFSLPQLSPKHEGYFLLALDIAFWFWIDDRSDKHLTEEAPQFKWDHLISHIEGKRHPADQTTPLNSEEKFYTRLKDAVYAHTSSQTERGHWRYTVAQAVRGMQFEELASRGDTPPSYLECAEYTMSSTALTNFLATASIVQGIDRGQRQAETNLVNIERYFCLFERLLNDYYTLEKERQEGENGKVTNLVLLLERELGTQKAVEFVKKDVQGTERILTTAMDRMDPDDPFINLIRHAMKNINNWYAQKPSRYKL